MPVPHRDDLFNPVLQALKRLGGSASIGELDEEVTKNLRLTPEEIAEPYDERRTRLQYRLAWARSYLKAYGAIENSSRGVWTLTPKGHQIEKVTPDEVVRSIRPQSHGDRRHNGRHSELGTPTEVAEEILEQSWKQQLLPVLLNMKPDAFERLCQRILRESGFVQVRVTGRAGDGGIDGVGLVRLGGLLSFPVLFQAKRFQGSVGPGIVRDFRGAMTGRADRGLIMTTGTFTRDATLEATRDGAPPIDLVDGDQLMEKLKELGLGVEVKMVEEVSVLPTWFQGI